MEHREIESLIVSQLEIQSDFQFVLKTLSNIEYYLFLAGKANLNASLKTSYLKYVNNAFFTLKTSALKAIINSNDNYQKIYLLLLESYGQEVVTRIN